MGWGKWYLTGGGEFTVNVFDGSWLKDRSPALYAVGLGFQKR